MIMTCFDLDSLRVLRRRRYSPHTFQPQNNETRCDDDHTIGVVDYDELFMSYLEQVVKV